MAIKALDPADWLEVGADRGHQMGERRRLLRERRDEVVAALPGSEEAEDELLALLLDHLQNHARDLYKVEPDAVFEISTGWQVKRQGTPPLDLIGQLAQEDFCILQRWDGHYILTAAVLCFPGHWSLAEKIGKSLIDIHAPVPRFAEQIGDPVARLFERLEPERPVQQLNWSLVDTNQLFLPPTHRRDPIEIGPYDVGARLRLRIERQTLRRLARSSAVIFGIRTHVAALDAAIDSPKAASTLLARLGELPKSMQTYKNVIDVKPALVAYLQRRQG